MRIAATSDLHGHLPQIPDCDVLVVAGDIGPPYGWYHERSRTAWEWLEGDFSDWIRSTPARVVGIAGNHDLPMERNEDRAKDLPWTYLSDSGCEIDGIKFWGSPWTPTFGEWAFMEGDFRLAARWAKIPADTDVLLTHGPPYGFADVNEFGQGCGSKTLMQWRR